MAYIHKRTIRSLSHSFYDLKHHFVWSPKYRGRVLESICRWKHWDIIELNIQPDHIHLVLLSSPRDSTSYVMQILKGKFSAWMKKKIKRVHGIYERKSLWAHGYSVSSIGID